MRSAQKDNPELMICSKQSHFQTQITQLKSITRELNIITGHFICTSDDEDCIDTVPDTCNYFNFQNITLLGVDNMLFDNSGSGSGSGSTSPGEEEEGGACDREEPTGSGNDGLPLPKVYTFGHEVGDEVLPATDDGSSPEIRLKTSVVFFGSSYTSLYVSVRSNISCIYSVSYTHLTLPTIYSV